MDKQEIAKSVAEILREKTGCQVQLEDAVMNNGVTVTALSILNNTRIVPRFYLESFNWEQKSPMELAEEIIKELGNHKDAPEWLNDLDLGQFGIKDIFFKVFSARMFPYENVTTFPLLDLLFVPYLMVNADGDGIASILVTKHIEESMGVNVATEFETIKQNTIEKFPLEEVPLFDLLQEMIGESYDDLIPEKCEDVPMIVLSNNTKVYGAATALLTEAYKKYAEVWESDLAILPSSVHEIICVPLLMEDQLSDMVKIVNTQCVRPTEVLEDHAYVYRRDKCCLEVLDV